MKKKPEKLSKPYKTKKEKKEELKTKAAHRKIIFCDRADELI